MNPALNATFGFGFEAPPGPISSVNQNGGLFGGFAGAQKQWGSWVLGIEADFDGANITGSSSTTVSGADLSGNPLTEDGTLDSKIDELGSVRGKVGLAAWQNWLFYGTGGLAFAHVNETLTKTASSETEPFEDSTATHSGGGSMFGWAAGGGIDYKWQIDPGSAVILGVEYLHYQFGTNTLTLNDQFGDGEGVSVNDAHSIDTIKGRISYLSSIH